jgi:DNA-binding HxlR family transcriptional regulator
MEYKSVSEDGSIDIKPFRYAMSVISGKWKLLFFAMEK